MALTPWLTSTDLIASVKRKISVPISQNTFLNLDILALANEEMFIAQVPSILTFHEEYFVTYKLLPLNTNVSRYPIPDRATGMKLRDIFWQDQNGNLFEMTRVEEHDRAFFQSNLGANQAIHKFFIEGNDVVLTPSVVDSPTGSLVMVFYLRPNQLVKNDRAAIVQNFSQTFTINNSLIVPLNIFSIAPLSTPNNPVGIVPFTAVNSLGGTITSITVNSADTVLIATSAAHQLTTGQTVILTGTNSNPVVDGTYIVSVLSPTTFTIPFVLGTSGNAGSFTSPNQFLIGGTGTATALNLSASINNVGTLVGNIANNNTFTSTFNNIYTIFATNNPIAFSIPTKNITFNFNAVPSTYTDDETNITEPLFVNNGFIDLLQTRPGHRTYVYDVQIPNNGISGNSITFPISSLLVPTGTVNNSAMTGSNDPVQPGIQYIVAKVIPGDYMCLANEAIIPQIPPDLHNGLAERTSARILAALGDQAGLQMSMQKIQEIEGRQGNLLDNRSEGTPQKVANRHSLLRYGNRGTFRRG